MPSLDPDSLNETGLFGLYGVFDSWLTVVGSRVIWPL